MIKRLESLRDFPLPKKAPVSLKKLGELSKINSHIARQQVAWLIKQGLGESKVCRMIIKHYGRELLDDALTDKSIRTGAIYTYLDAWKEELLKQEIEDGESKGAFVKAHERTLSATLKRFDEDIALVYDSKGTNKSEES